jgi:hypothetical protein
MSIPEPEPAPPEPPPALPTLVRVSRAFSQRLPTQRTIDALVKIEGAEFGDLAQHQPFRLTAFRALQRDFPDYDPTALWMHAYDTEVEVEDENPTNGTSPTSGPSSPVTGAFVPAT